MSAEDVTRDDLRSRTAEALPMLHADTLEKVMVRLDELGVESPADMELLREEDLGDVLKVVQCRRLLKYFQDSVIGGSISTCNRNSAERIVHASDALQTAVVSPLPKTISAQPDKDVEQVSAGRRTSSKQLDDASDRSTECTPDTERSAEENDERNGNKQICLRKLPLSGAENIAEATSPVLLLAKLCSAESGNTFANELGTDTLKNLPTKSDVRNPEYRNFREFVASNLETGSEKFQKSLRSYSLRLDILPATIRQDLKKQVLLNKKKLTDLVRIVAEDVMDTIEKPSLKDLRLVTRSLFGQYPNSLCSLECGDDASSTFVMFYKKLVNRIYNEMRKKPKDNSFGVFSQGDDEAASSDSFAGLSDNIIMQGTYFLADQLSQQGDGTEPSASQTFSELEIKLQTQDVSRSSQPQRTMSTQTSMNALKRMQICGESFGTAFENGAPNSCAKSSSAACEEHPKSSDQSGTPNLPHEADSGDVKIPCHIQNLQQSISGICNSDSSTKESVVMSSTNCSRESRSNASGLGPAVEELIMASFADYEKLMASMLCPSPEHDNSTDSVGSVSLISSSSSRVTSTGDLFENYTLPLKHLPGILRQDLMEHRVLNKQNVTSLVRLIAEHVMRLVDKPSAEDLRLVTKSVFKQYPDSLRSAICGNHGKPGYESFLRKLINRVSNEGRKREESSAGTPAQSCQDGVSPKVIVQPETGLLDVQISEGNVFLLPENPFQPQTTEKMESSPPETASFEEHGRLEHDLLSCSDEDSTSCPAADAQLDQKEEPVLYTIKPYKIPLKKLPLNVQYSLQNNVFLSPKDTRTLVRVVTDDLQVNGQRPKTRQMKIAARALLNSFPRSFQSSESDFDAEKEYYNLFKRILNRINNIYRRSNLNNSIVREHFESQPPNKKDSQRKQSALAGGQEGTASPCIQNSAVNSTSFSLSPYSPDYYWCNYKLPFEELPPIVQFDLISSRPLSQPHRKELVRVIVNDVLKTVPNPKKHELGKLVQAVVETYPECFERNSQNAGSVYETFLIELMRAVNPNMPLSDANNPCETTFNVRISSSLSLASRAQHSSLLALKNNMKRRSRNEGWSDVVADEMKSTYRLQRQDIEQGASVDDLMEDWPYLFHKQGFFLHLRLLLGCCLQSKLENAFHEKRQFLVKFFTETGDESCHSSMFSHMEASDVDALRLILMIVSYFGEDPTQLLCKPQDSINAEESQEKSSQPIILMRNYPSDDRFLVSLNGAIILQDLSYVTTFAIYFGSFFMFNLDYPSSLAMTLEFIQRYFVQLNSQNDDHLCEEIPDKVSLLLKIVCARHSPD